MNDNLENNTEPAEENFDVGSFRPEDAGGVVRLFRAVYGEHYPIKLFYDPQAIIAVNEAKKYYSIVARTVSGDIIGVGHLFRSAPYPSIYEYGVGLILKEYRNTGAFTRMSEYLFTNSCPNRIILRRYSARRYATMLSRKSQPCVSSLWKWPWK